MNVEKYLEPKIAPRGVFDALLERNDRVRFKVARPLGGWDDVTWGAFADQIRELSLFLRAGGMKAGDTAAVFASNSVAWGAAALAIQAAGGVMVPVYPASTADQAAYVIEHAEARFVFLGAALLEKVADRAERYGAVVRFVTLDDVTAGKAAIDARIGDRVVSYAGARAMGAARHAKDPAEFLRTMHGVPLEAPGLMLYTSGTTGNPKGVPLTHANVAANGKDWFVCNAPVLEEDVTDLLWLPMSHIFGLGELCIGNTLGWTSYLIDPASVMAKLPEVAPRVFMSVPAYWEKISIEAQKAADPRARLKELTGGNLRFCLSGGAGLKREVKDFFHDAGILIVEGYGLTETSPTLTLNRPDAFRFDTVGRPLPSVEIRLAEDGEILAKGPNVFGGYHKDAAATKEAFTDDGWFKTGDVGRFTPDGFLQIIDRKKDILVTAGGKNVPPVNIEARFGDDPLISHAVVYGDAKRYLVAGFWVTEPITPATRVRVQERVDRVNESLASYETVKRFALFDRPLTVEGGFLTAALKVRRRKIYDSFRADFEALYEAPAAADSPPKETHP